MHLHTTSNPPRDRLQYSLSSRFSTILNIIIVATFCSIALFAGLLLFPLSRGLFHLQYSRSVGLGGPIREIIFNSEVNHAAHSDTHANDSLKHCPGYHASQVDTSLPGRLTIDLFLHADPCNAYGEDLPQVRLEVTYESKSMLRLRFTDPHHEQYDVPDEIIHDPVKSPVPPEASLLEFKFTKWPNPFQFQILRRSTGEAIFNTANNPLVFEPQYLRLKSVLPQDANIYGFGEHSGTFRFDTSRDIIRTLWARDSPSLPYPGNLYGSHPIYVEYRETSQMAHGVFLKNSNGMDIKLKNKGDYISLEYNVIGGMLDLFFFAGDGGPENEGDPKAVAREYSKVIGAPVMTPYWNLGFHQCRWGYRDWFEAAEVVANYSQADIPLETMWIDIDYMSKRHIFTLDPDNFPKERTRQVVKWLHDRGQKFVMMVDPAVAHNTTLDGHDYETFIRGKKDGIFLMRNESTIYKGVVWPGVVAYPDWFHENITTYWTKEFEKFFDKDTGIDIDGVWIDMNEPSNFCSYPCSDPEKVAKESGLPPPAPPKRDPPRKIPGFLDSGISFPTGLSPEIDGDRYELWKRTYAPKLAALRLGNGLQSQSPFIRNARKRSPGSGYENLLKPPYAIHNLWPNGLSDKTIDTDVRHGNGLYEYDVHNLFGTGMGYATYAAMLKRRPNKRPVVVGRSTFPGAQRKIFHWLGDNVSSWEQYRGQIAYMLGFSAIYQMPMVGSDICGFAGDTTATLCARWAMLGAFNPFMRNHNTIETPVSQEFYRWPIVADAARKAIAIRYRLLDYLYTALWRQSRDGTPAMTPLWMALGKGVDHNTLHLEYQFMYGDALMVAPVVKDDAKTVVIYFPTGRKEDPIRWFDFDSLTEVTSATPSPSKPGCLGFSKEYANVDYNEIPLFWKSGNVVPLRKNSAHVTDQLRKQDFVLLVVPGVNGDAYGALYLDDGVSITQERNGTVVMSYLMLKEEENTDVLSARNLVHGGRDKFSGNEEYRPEYLDVKLDGVTILGVERTPRIVTMNTKSYEWEGVKSWRATEKAINWDYDGQKKVLRAYTERIGIGEEFEVRIGY